VGTYRAQSAVWHFDLDAASRNLLTGAADSTARMFDVETGQDIHAWSFRSPVRCVSLAENSPLFLAVSDAVMGQPSTISFFDRRSKDLVRDIKHPTPSMKYHRAIWGPGNRKIYVCDDCAVAVYDFQNMTEIQQSKKHTKPAVSFSFSEDRTHFVTASHDHTAKLWDTVSLENLKTYETEKPVNAAVISPLKDHILLGGGQSASQVTTTRQDTTQFKLRFFHKIFEDELATLPGHFGPVNTLAFAPDGSFASGGEDGFVRVHNLEDPIIFSLGDDEEDNADEYEF